MDEYIVRIQDMRFEARVGVGPHGEPREVLLKEDGGEPTPHEVVVEAVDADALILRRGNRVLRIPFARTSPGVYDLAIDGVALQGAVSSRLEERVAERAGRVGPGAFVRKLKAHMPGKIVKVSLGPGDEVAEGQVLIVLEAMKMENAIRATAPARVVNVHVERGDSVEDQALLLDLEPLEEGTGGNNG